MNHKEVTILCGFYCTLLDGTNNVLRFSKIKFTLNINHDIIIYN